MILKPLKHLCMEDKIFIWIVLILLSDCIDRRSYTKINWDLYRKWHWHINYILHLLTKLLLLEIPTYPNKHQLKWGEPVTKVIRLTDNLITLTKENLLWTIWKEEASLLLVPAIIMYIITVRTQYFPVTVSRKMDVRNH